MIFWGCSVFRSKSSVLFGGKVQKQYNIVNAFKGGFKALGGGKGH